MRIVGWDVGGANIKATLMEVQGPKAKRLKTVVKYFPIWKEGKEKLQPTLEGVKRGLVGSSSVDVVGVTMTIELSDVYRMKRDGVCYVLDCIEDLFPGASVLVVDADGHLRGPEEARAEHLKVAGANWGATAWMVARWVRDCILLDVGSTTTDIVPILDGRIAAKGKNDTERLATGELVYTGALRTNVSTIVPSVPFRGRMARVASELFALSADVHLILGNITEDEYSTETADGRGRSKEEALSRVARVVCADTEMLDERDILLIAEHVYQKQLEQIGDALKQVSETIGPEQRKAPIIVTGLGRNFLGAEATRRLGFEEIVDLADRIGRDASIAAPSAAVAMMAAFERGVREVEWS